MHFAGCLFMYLNTPEDFIDQKIENGNFYLNSVFFMLTTFSTIGYGDLSVNTKKLLSTFVMTIILILGVSFIGYIIASLKHSISQFQEINQKANHKFEYFESWLATRELTKNVYIS
jgi:amino acid transporter